MNSLVALPIAAATPVAAPAFLAATGRPDRRALEAYASWLFMERRILCGELWPHMGTVAEKFDFADNAGWGWHFRGEIDWRDHPQPSTRAAAVLDHVGVNWRGRPKEDDLGLGEVDNGARPMLPASWPERDGELREALESLKAHDLALAGLHKAHGDEADSREDYRELEEARDDCLSTLINTEASSMVGVLAKATALQQQALIEDYEGHQSIAISLAEDLVRPSQACREVAPAKTMVPSGHPDRELIELGGQFIEISRGRDTALATLEAADGRDKTAEAAFDDAMDQLRSIYARMIGIRPTTVEGMRAIASAVFHFEWDGKVENFDGTIESTALAALVAGLLDKPLPEKLPDWAAAWA
ncbi:hypothetical protein [Bradyrhizobium sp. USDA 3256]